MVMRYLKRLSRSTFCEAALSVSFVFGFMAQLFNAKNNIHGELCQIIIGTTVLSKGIDLHNVREIHIFEPQWRDTTVQQILGRATRIFSHKDLEPHERTVTPYIYVSTPLDRAILASITEYRGDITDTKITPSLMSTDEFLWDLSNRKKAFHEEFLHAMKEAAVDCRLNLYFNETDKKIICKSCPVPVAKSLFPYNIVDHIRAGPTCVREETDVGLWPIPEHPGVRKDINNKLYELKGDTWIEVGYIDDDTGEYVFW